MELKDKKVAPLSAGRYVLITVTDNGKGIPPGNLPKIYEPYFTTRTEVNRKGLGMGLTIALSIIKRHKGSIDVSSQVGTGTTFRIYLPAR